MSDALKKLRQQIEALKHASIFEVRDCADAALSQALAVLDDQEKRIDLLERRIGTIDFGGR